MSKLIQLGQTGLNGQPTTGIQVLIPTGSVLDILDAPGGSSRVIQNTYDGSNPTVISASSPASTYLTAMNAAGGESINSISVTVVDDYGNTKIHNINPDNIQRVVVDSLNGAKSYVAYYDSVRSKVDQLHCTNTLASILAAANA